MPASYRYLNFTKSINRAILGVQGIEEGIGMLPGDQKCSPLAALTRFLDLTKRDSLVASDEISYTRV